MMRKRCLGRDISGSSQNITANGNLSWNLVDQFARYIRCVVVVGAGSFTLSLVVHAKKSIYMKKFILKMFEEGEGRGLFNKGGYFLS